MNPRSTKSQQNDLSDVYNTSASASTIPTSDLPDGVPEDQMKDAKTHGLGHLQSTNHTLDS